MSDRKHVKKLKSILKDIQDGKHIRSFDDNDSDYLMDVVDKNFVRGLSYSCDLKGTPYFITSYPSLTREGERYLKQRCPKFKENLSLGLSITALTISLLSMFINLLANLQNVIDGLELMKQLMR